MVTLIAALVLLPLISGQTFNGPKDTGAQTYSPPSEPYSAGRLAALRSQGQNVFVNFTAAWCITCLVNERVVFSSEEVKARFDQGDITYLKADRNSSNPLSDKLYPPGQNGPLLPDC